MPTVDVIREVDCQESFRTKQLAGMFDLPIKNKLRHEWHIDLPIEDVAWNIGLIVGPSGSGKSTVCRELFGDAVHERFDWPKAGSVLDGFSKATTTSDCVAALNAVGFSSPPSWLKPFAVLSTGERFRAELARAMVDYSDRGLFVIDEFTSVVDRTVAQIGSAAVAKAVRRRKMQMVAVSCHYDVAAWLEPDWVLDMKTQTFSRRCLRRPEIEIELHATHRGIWPMFASHHYLNGQLSPSARCYCGIWAGQIVAFAAILASMGHTGVRRVHRLVVLPDFQGCGIGRAMLKMLGQLCSRSGHRLSLVSTHPAMLRGLKADTQWRCAQFWSHGTSRHTSVTRNRTGRSGVPAARFEYVGGA